MEPRGWPQAFKGTLTLDKARPRKIRREIPPKGSKMSVHSRLQPDQTWSSPNRCGKTWLISHVWMEMGRSGNLMSEPNISMLAGCPQGRISTTRRKRLGMGWKGGLWKIATFDAHQVRRSCRDEFTREGLRIVHDIEINQLLQLDIVSPREHSCDGSHSFVSFRGLSVVSKSARGQRLQSQCAQQATATACFCLLFFTKQGGSSLAQRLWLASSHPHPPNRFCPHSQILEHPRLPSAQQLRAPLNAVHHICEKSRHILANRHVGNDLAEARL